ncbi:mitochondrial cytochrome b2-like protein [Dactylonectria estremocensis]|uniref:L-lactate dehydrogenase (cytochrome) n=1 Tax=Dactylonectria estremocensis TaxID=1079267 RepID=A0A9P9E2T5_9HYPO|nr:mitochondrial cytochrome b2-like protein [Dactylonectria estremocensis]
MASRVSPNELILHNKNHDVWIVINGNVYDMTEFAPQHPGGPEIIYQFAGRDASDEYNSIHAPSLIQKSLKLHHQLGPLEVSCLSPKSKKDEPEQSLDAPSPSILKPALSKIINLRDFESAASLTLSKKAWAYIQGASNDNLTRDANSAFLNKIWLRPSVMRNVGNVSTKTRLFGCHLDLPVFISPTGAVRTAGQEGELALARGAARMGIIQCIATPASYPHEEIIDATPQHAWFQLYLNKDRAKSQELLRLITSSGKVKAIFITADLPVVSKREADERAKASNAVEAARAASDWKGSGLARQTGTFIDPTLNWDDLSWLRQQTTLPIVVKGIQRWEDAKLAMQSGCQGIVLSNHGGRAADGSSPTIVLLLELHRNCPEIFSALEVLIDGGFRRGSDVVKAVCLGASAVGFGRPFVYAVNYGQDGVSYAVDILRDEIETAMRLCGMTDLMADAHPDYVNTTNIDHCVLRGGHPYAKKSRKMNTKL